MEAIGGRSNPVFQPEEIRFSEIPIAPLEEGIFPALAALWLEIQNSASSSNLDEITQKIAATNFFKQSLMKEGKNINTIGPAAEKLLGAQNLQAYIARTLDLYVLPEIEILQPRIIFAYKTFTSFL